MPSLRNSVYICYCVELVVKDVMVPILSIAEAQCVDLSHNTSFFHCSTFTDKSEHTRGVEICLWIPVDKLNGSNYRPCDVLFSVGIRNLSA